ncbi:Outer membrane receptor proteins, mostly Fe transport [Pseudoalteromonas luteoviolacea B = ATCC 29581]|nr:Outer membrane receptor proteins, mostly Fe transport [Pseudoalteromonas luteoviolacea B = ATCC 29581]
MYKLSAITLCVLSVSSSLLAKETGSEEKLQSVESIETIEVYAQKRLQSILDVPVTVDVIQGEVLSNERVKDITELGRFSSNVKISQNAAEGTTPTISIRGVGLIDYNTANTAPVAVYIDGNPVGSGNNQVVNLFDIEQVEVLKGPQGTLFGRNSTGGAILVRSVRPSFERNAYLQAGKGSDDYREFEGAFNLPLNETVSTRLALSHKNYDYTTNNLFDDSPEAGMEQNNIRFGLTSYWDNAELYVQARYQRWTGIVQPVGNIGVLANPATGELCSPDKALMGECFDAFGFNDHSNDFWDVSVNNHSPHETRSKGLSSEYQWFYSDDLTVTWLGQVSTLDRLHHFNCDGSPARLCEGYLGLDNDFYSNELRVNFARENYNLVVGAYHQKEIIEQDNANDILRDFRGILPTTLTATFAYDNRIISNDLSVFAQIDWFLNDKNTVTVGGRYSIETLRYESDATLNVVIDDNNLDGTWIPFYRVEGDEKDRHFSHKLAWNHKINNQLTGFYSYSNGTKSGGYNGGFLSSVEQAALAYYGPETLNAHEIGMRYHSNELNLNIDSAFFYYDYQDQQVFMNQPASTPGQVPLQLLENVADSTIYGLEINSKFAFSPQFDIMMMLGYIPKAEFEEYIDPVGNKLTNNRLPFTSEWNAAATVNYKLTNVPIRVSVGADFQSEYYFDQNENPYAMQSSYTLWNSSVWYERERWQVGIWAKNVFDEEYSHLKFDLMNFLGMLEDFKGEGRRVGVSLKVMY